MYLSGIALCETMVFCGIDTECMGFMVMIKKYGFFAVFKYCMDIVVMIKMYGFCADFN
jgi:hypothetical protein